MLSFGYYVDGQSGGVQDAYPNRYRSGAFIRERRNKLGMDQIDLARRPARAGVARRSGTREPGAEIGLILRTLKSLEISITWQRTLWSQLPRRARKKHRTSTCFGLFEEAAPEEADMKIN